MGAGADSPTAGAGRMVASEETVWHKRESICKLLVRLRLTVMRGFDGFEHEWVRGVPAAASEVPVDLYSAQ